MKKNLLMIVILIIIIVILIIYTIFNNKKNTENKNNLKTLLENNITIESNNDVSNISNSSSDKSPKYLESLNEIPIPDSIIFYHNGVQKTFFKETDVFNQIIALNNRRDSKKLGALQLVVDINGLLKNTNMLEYAYKNYDPVYFNLISDEQLKKDNTTTNWVAVGYDKKVFNQFIYGGLLSANDLINYLNSLK